MAKQICVQLASVAVAFDYAPLKPSLADQIRSTATRIRDRVKHTLEGIIMIGHDLLTVKEALPHGQFGPWLLFEFGWTDRTARNFMAVAEQFGAKTEMISDLSICPTAAYLLAAPSAPFEARQAALDRAKSGERITAAIANEILEAVKNNKPKEEQALPWERKWQRLARILDRFRASCDSKDLRQFTRELRQFVSVLKKGKRRSSGTFHVKGRTHE